jgi:hypothetical protein
LREGEKLDKPHVSIDGIEVDLDTFPARSLGIREYKTARANSAGFQALYPKLADEALVAAVEHWPGTASPKRPPGNSSRTASPSKSM